MLDFASYGAARIKPKALLYQGNEKMLKARRVLLATLLSLIASGTLAADDPAPPPGAVPPEDPPTYVGARTRIGLGYQSRDQLRGEFYHLLTEDKSSALIGEGWVAGRDGRYGAGLKLSYQWLPETQAKFGASVRKAFLAVDQNLWHDRKLSVGGGLENEAYFFGGYLSGGITGRREISAIASSVTDTLQGVDGGRPYLQDFTTTTTVRTFERPYDYGLGLRLGTFVEPALLRITGGLDQEWGRGDARQTTGSVALEKFFYNSPISVALVGEYFRKSGQYETERDDHRVSLVLRYELGGKAHRPIRESKVVRVETPAPAVAEPAAAPVAQAAQPRVEKRAVKVTATMAADAFFKFDSAQLTDDAKKALSDVIATLRNNKYEGSIVLTGHTCDIGADDYNLRLSMRRAMAVKKYLNEIGSIGLEVLVAEGRGEANPRFANTKATRHKNRRVDLEFVTYTEKLEDVILPADPVVARPAAPAVKREPIVEWRREYLDTEPAWVRRALHNTLPHKQAVDVYRQQEKETTVSEGPRRYLNRPPVAANDSYAVLPGSSDNLFEVLANDSDPDGDSLAIASVAPPAQGTASLSGNRVSYAPRSGFTGTDSFTYTVSDGKGGTASATVTVSVQAPNRPPLAANDSYEVLTGSSGNLFAVLANDSDPDGDSLSISAVSTPAQGTANLSNGQVSYTPAAGFSGADSFSYTISDGHGGSATATVSVTVRASNRPPVANADSYAVASGSSGNSFDVLANDSDPDGNTLTITSVGTPAHGVATVSGNRVLYTPAAGYSGSDSFSYTISDGLGGTATALVSVSVGAAGNRPPVANDDFYTVYSFSPVVMRVLDNDFDPDGDRLTVISFTQPQFGQVALNADGSFTFTLTQRTLMTTFFYTVSDGRGGTATAKVTVIDP